MFVFDGRCPHCGSDKGFAAFGLGTHIIKEPRFPDAPHVRRQAACDEKKEFVLFSLAGDCLACHKPVVATCKMVLAKRDEVTRCIADPFRNTLEKVAVLDIFPHPKQPYSHPSLSEPVRTAFIDLQRMVEKRMLPFFIIAGCRTVLEAAVRELGGEGKTLYQRIQDLRAKGVITSTLEEWATIIREEGNAAVHEMHGTEEQAEELVNFTKVFLQFTFELPAAIKGYRKEN